MKNKKVKFPKTIHIQNQTWLIEFCDIRNKMEELNADVTGIEPGESVLGFCDVAHRHICVEEFMSDAAKTEVLVHEIGHAFFATLPHSLGFEHDEQFARIFATSVLDLVLNNGLDWAVTE